MEQNGWICQRSKSYPDRVYYFNILTGASSWEKPDLLLYPHPTSPQSYDREQLLVQSPDQKKVPPAGKAQFSPAFSVDSSEDGYRMKGFSKQDKLSKDNNSVSSSSSDVSDFGNNLPGAKGQSGLVAETKQTSKNNTRKSKEQVAKNLDEKFDSMRKSTSSVKKVRSVHNSDGDKICVTVNLDELDGDSQFAPLSGKHLSHGEVPVGSTGKLTSLQGRIDLGPDERRDQIKSAKKRRSEELYDHNSVGSQSSHHELCGDETSSKKRRKNPTSSVGSAGNSSATKAKRQKMTLNPLTASASSSKKSVRNLDSTPDQKNVPFKNIQSTLKKSHVSLDKRLVLSSDSSSPVSAKSDIKKSTPVNISSEKSKAVLPKSDSGKPVTSSTSSVETDQKPSKKLEKLKYPTNPVLADPSSQTTVKSKQLRKIATRQAKKETETQTAASKYEPSLDTQSHVKSFISAADPSIEKYKNIQSWINSLEEGSGSGSPLCDDAASTSSRTSDKRVVVSDSKSKSDIVSVPSTSRNLAKRFTERGWPGKTTVPPSDSAQHREITDMEVDEISLPENDIPPEDMVVDMVLSEVRQHVSSKPQDLGMDLGCWLEERDPDTPGGCVRESLHVILDTNIIISDLTFIEDFKDQFISGYGKPTLVIPWIVLQELDALKDSHKTDIPNLSLGTQIKARKGIAFLQTCFKTKHPRVVGQTPKQAQQAALEFSAVNNDDIVIQTCLQCQKNYPDSLVVLMTNDNNLINKSLVCGVQAFKRTNIIQGLEKSRKSKATNPIKEEPPPSSLGNPPSDSGSVSVTGVKIPFPDQPHTTPITPQRPDFMVAYMEPTETKLKPVDPAMSLKSQSKDSSVYSLPANVGSEPGNPSPCKSTPTTPRVNENLQKQTVSRVSPPTVVSVTEKAGAVSSDHQSETDKLDSLVDEMYGKLKKLLREALGKTLETEMTLAYDDIWEDIVYRKPPWSLRDILDSMKKHWIAVFGMVFHRSLLKNVEKLIQHFSFKTEVTLVVLTNIAEDSLPLLEECVKRNKYGGTMKQICRCVSCIRQLCVDLSSKKLMAASIESLETYLSQQLKSLIVMEKDSSPIINNNHIKPSKNPSESLSQNAPDRGQTGTTAIPPQTQAETSNSVNQFALVEQARGKLQSIWGHIYKYCDELGKVLQNLEKITPTILNNIQILLHKLVPLVKGIRIQFGRMFELSPASIAGNEKEFLLFSNYCQAFYTDLQLTDKLPQVSENHFLALFKDDSQRASIGVFLNQLDEMTCHLYRCVSHLANSGVG